MHLFCRVCCLSVIHFDSFNPHKHPLHSDQWLEQAKVRKAGPDIEVEELSFQLLEGIAPQSHEVFSLYLHECPELEVLL